MIIGLTGGVASGKSFVASCLQELGAILIDADQVAHEVLQDARTIKRIVEHWGNEILDPQGNIDRRRLGEIVFSQSGDQDLSLLESITHPEIRKRIQTRLEELGSSAKGAVVVLDIPLLFEGNYDQHCDRLIFVDTPKDLRLRRAMLRGWSDDELDRRESRQLSVEEKKLRSDVLIDNSKSKESTAREIARFWTGLGREIPESFRVMHLGT